MAQAKKLPSGHWRCRPSFTDDRGQKHVASFTAATKREAEAKALAWQAGLIDRRDNALAKPLSEALDEYIETCRCAGHSPSTIRAYVATRNHAFDDLIDIRLDRITTKDVQNWINARSKKYAPKTIKNNLAMLHAVFKAEGKKFDFEALKLPKARRTETKIATDEQVAAVLDDNYADDDMYIAIALASLMGLRRSEICALKWSDVKTSGDKAYLTVNKALVRDEHGVLTEKDTKTTSGQRILPIPSTLYAELRRRRNLNQNMVTISPNSITERYMRDARRLGLPPRFHALRHYHASVMLSKNAPEKYIVEDMGHSTFEMVKQVYGHTMDDKRSEIYGAMDDHASKIIAIAAKVTREA
jgi:integrase